MPASIRRRELGRGERVLPGVWRLRLPLPFPEVPHCNAWALRAGDGIVLVDCGMDEEGSPEQLVRAMRQVGLRLEDVRLLVCTHAHADHYGQAADVIDASGCELWLHPDHTHMTLAAGSPDEAMSRRIEIARTSGVPVEPLAEWVEAAHRPGFGIKRIVEPDRDLVPGVVIDTDLGRWTVHETPGHAPSHVCLHQAERRILISGDHLLGRVSPYFDYGWSPDPVGEFLTSLDVVDRLDARLCLAGHARTFTDVRAHIEANRALMRERLERTRQIVAEREPVTAHDVVPLLYGAPITSHNASWWMQETLCYLRHLEVTGALSRGGDPERWSAP